MKISLFSYAVILLVLVTCPTNGEHQDADAVSITDPLTKKRLDGDGMPFFFYPGGVSGGRKLLAQANLCDSHPAANEFKPLTVSIVPETDPSRFAIEGAKGIKFTFSTCGQTDKDTYLVIEDSSGNRLAFEGRESFEDDNCPGGSTQTVLTWTFSDNDEYYLFVGGYESLPFTTNVVWSTDKYWSRCFETCGPNILGPTIAACGDDIPLKCCDSSTGNIGPECCDKTPYDPKVSSCCNDGSLVNGVNNEAACAPSAAPSSPPTSSPTSAPSSPPTPLPSAAPSSSPSSLPSAAPSSQPTTSVPSSQPSDSTCDNGDPCHYEFDKDTFEVVETYFPVCVQDTKKGKLIYRQECYPSSILAGVGPTDPDPEHPNDDDRFIIECGCCPTEGLPPSITDVKDVNKVPACNKISNDCIAEGFRPSKVSKSGKKAYMDDCINGSDEEEENFYIKKGDESVACGTCGMMI